MSRRSRIPGTPRRHSSRVAAVACELAAKHWGGRWTMLRLVSESTVTQEKRRRDQWRRPLLLIRFAYD